MSRTLLVATHNRGKVIELTELLDDLDVQLVSLADLEAQGVAVEPVAETGTSFLENALLKAAGYGRQTGLLTLADDSGLEVDALDGTPGVYTARYGGAALSSEERYRFLLRNLEGIPWEERGARFRCVVALAEAQEVVATAEGTVEGKIAAGPSGEGGFGYDPVFYVGEQGRTMAELPAAVKNHISHRARAVAAIKPFLERLLSQA